MTYVIKMSKGEQKIASLLTSARVRYKQEVSFKGLTGDKGVPLRFDFAIFNSCNQLTALIEFDGQQHFKFTPHFHKSNIDFHRQQQWDIKKNKFCLSNHIPLIRVPYWEIESLTLTSLFTNPKYQVKTKNHNLNLEVRK